MSTGTKVFVGNLAYSTTEEDLLNAFAKCGKVTEAKVVRRGNRSKGYGFVDFEDENDAQKSVDALDKVELNGRSINVQISTSTNTGDDDDDGDKQVRRNDNNDRPYNNYRRNNNYGGGGRYNNNSDGGRYNNNSDGGRYNNNSGGGRYNNNSGGGRYNNNSGGGRYNNNNNNVRRNWNNRDNNSGSPTGRKMYSLRKNSDNEDNYENKRRYTRSNAEKVESTTVVFVANLPYSFYDEDLVDLFKQCGEIKTAHVVRTRGKSKGYGFVEFQTHDGQVAALEKMDNFTVENSRGEERNLSVKVAMQETGKVNDNESEQETGKDKDEEGEKNVDDSNSQ